MAADASQGGADKPESWDDRREYIRVPADCPVTYRILDHREQTERKAGRDWLWSLPMSPLPDRHETGSGHDASADSGLMEMLLCLDWKVSLLIKTLVSQRQPEQFPHSGIMSEVSGSGMKLVTSEAPEAGSLIELDVILPVTPFHNLFLTGEVIRGRPVKNPGDENRFEVGVAFRDLNEIQRDHLVRYALKRQMQLQRERRAV
jgi:hypothetical protein